MLRLIVFYRRWISPLLVPRCRFFPSCSAYAVEAIETHGTMKGSLLSIKRMLKCHPFHPGGVDLVPTSTDCATSSREPVADSHQSSSNRQNTLNQ